MWPTSEIDLPTLIIHGEDDMLVPLEHARDLYDHPGTKEKELLVIHSATHNDVLIVGFKDYFKAIQRRTEKKRRNRVQGGIHGKNLFQRPKHS
jgi:alpha-beta hydrolase superfamily lysophospholipase